MPAENKNIITGGFTGQLGNQMFQIASVIGLAKKHGAQYTFQRPTDNDVWKIYFSHFPELPTPDRKYFHETENRYQEIPYDGGTLVLVGFFQSYKYFDHCRKKVLDAFGFPWRLNKGIVSIHVRRNDYKVGTPFEPVTIDYISRAIKRFNKEKHFRFKVFSDDMGWCRQHVNSINFPRCQFEYSEGRTALEDIQEMSCCEHHITANSTYSVWGAELNRNPRKIVVCPRLSTWFNGVNQDILRPEWIQI